MSSTGLKVVGGTDVDPAPEAELPEIAAEANPGLSKATDEATKARRLFQALNDMSRSDKRGAGFGEAPGIDGTVLEYYEYDVDAAAKALGIDLTVEQ